MSIVGAIKALIQRGPSAPANPEYYTPGRGLRLRAS